MSPDLRSLFIILVLACGYGIAGDWPNWRGPDRNGVSTELIPGRVLRGGKPRLLWTNNVGSGYSSVSCINGRIYTVGNKDGRDMVFCLLADSGKQVWRFEYKEELAPFLFSGGTTATPVVSGGRMYSISRSGIVHCLDAGSGKLNWKRNLQNDYDLHPPVWGFSGSPLVLGDIIYLNAGEHGIALNARSGELVWKSPSFIPGFSTPVLFTNSGKPALAFFGRRAVFSVHPGNGKVYWKYKWETPWGENTADPLPIGRFLYLSTAHKMGSVLLDTTGNFPREIWRNPDFENHVDTPMVHKGYLYGSSGRINRPGGSFQCVSLKTGKSIWQVKKLKASANLAGKILMILSLDGELILAPADPSGFKPVLRFRAMEKPCWTPPVLANGLLYIRNGEGNIACFDLRD